MRSPVPAMGSFAQGVMMFPERATPAAAMAPGFPGSATPTTTGNRQTVTAKAASNPGPDRVQVPIDRAG